MILTGFKIYRYELPLFRSIRVKNLEISIRNGLIIEVEDEKKNTGYGEVAPISGLHEENPDMALRDLRKVRFKLLNNTIPNKLADLEGGFDDWLAEFSLLPSVRFGVETAMLGLMAAVKKVSLAQLFSENYQAGVPLNGLIVGSAEEVINEAKQLKVLGYKSIKLKVGRETVDKDIRNVKKLSDVLGKEMSLRLDANRSWSVGEALKFARGVVDVNIEYIEEPLKQTIHLPDFMREVRLPVALDESLLEMSAENLHFWKNVKAVVLKPSVLGGFEKTAKFVRMALDKGIRPVVSATFETGIALSALAHFAAAYIPSHTAAGLDTWRWLEEDLLIPRFQTVNGRINIEKLKRESMTIRMELLKPVS